MQTTLAPFSIARLPRIEFGAGAIRKLPVIAAQYGKRLLIITGAGSFTDSVAAEALFHDLQAAGFSWEIRRVTQEPSPQWVDATVAACNALSDMDFDAVIGIGGGSPLDAAKAVAGLLKPGNSVLDHLEGVGPNCRIKALPHRSSPCLPRLARVQKPPKTRCCRCRANTVLRNRFAMSAWLPNTLSLTPICWQLVHLRKLQPMAWMRSPSCWKLTCPPVPIL